VLPLIPTSTPAPRDVTPMSGLACPRYCIYISALFAPSVFIPPILSIGGCLGSERLSFRSPTGTPVIHPIHWVNHLSFIPQHALSLSVFVLKDFSSTELTASIRTITTMPALYTYPQGDVITTLLSDDRQAAPTPRVTIHPGYTRTPRKVAEDSDSLSPVIIGVIAAVSALAVICVVTAAFLHQLWCKNPGCKACLIFTCGRRKPQKGTYNTPLHSRSGL